MQRTLKYTNMLVISYGCLSIAFLFITSLTASCGVEGCFSELEVAVSNNDVKTIEWFLSSNESKSVIEERAHKIAYIVAEKGNLNILEYIVSRRPSVLRKKEKSTYTSIARIAAQSGHLDLVCYVAKTDSRSRCRKYEDIIRTAIGKSQRRDNKTLEMVLQLAIEWENTSCSSIIVIAYEQNDTKIIQYIAEKKASLFLGRAKSGENHLKIAIENNFVNQEFLEGLAAANDARMNGHDDYSENTICLLAARYDRLEVIQFIANRSESSLPKVSCHMETVFHIAAERGFVDIIRYIVRENPLMTVDGRYLPISVLHYSIEENVTDMDTLKYLVEEKKVPPTITDPRNKGTIAHTAAHSDKIDMLLYLVKKEPSLLTMKDSNGLTVLDILHYCKSSYNLSMNVSKNITQSLANSTARKDLCSKVGFIAAAYREYIFLLMDIVELEPSILRIEDGKFGTILHILADGMDELSIEKLKFFVDKGACLTSQRNYSSQTVAHILSAKRRTDLVEYLVEREPSILHLVDRQHETILHLLAKENALSVEILDFFVNKGAPLLMKNNEGDTVVRIEGRKGNVEILEYIVEKEYSRPTKNSRIVAEVVDVASGYGHLSVLKLVVEKEPAFLVEKLGILFNLSNRSDIVDTPKYLKAMCQTKIRNWDSRHFQLKVSQTAIEYDYPDVFECMNCDVNMIHDTGEPPIFAALRLKRLNSFRYLAADGETNLTALDVEGNNILFVAARNRDLQNMKYILDTLKVPFEIEWRNNEGDTLLHVAVQASSQADRAFMMYSQKNVSEIKRSEEYADNNCEQGTVSEESSEETRHLSVIEYLVEQKHADINARGHQNKTALHYAASRGNYRIFNYLLDRTVPIPDFKTRVNTISGMKHVFQPFPKAGKSIGERAIMKPRLQPHMCPHSILTKIYSEVKCVFNAYIPEVGEEFQD